MDGLCIIDPVEALACGIIRRGAPQRLEAGVEVGILPPGALNAITDVEGVRVGHVAVIEGDSYDLPGLSPILRN